MAAQLACTPSSAFSVRCAQPGALRHAQQRTAVPAPALRRAAPARRRALAARAAWAPQAPPGAAKRLSLELPTEDFQRSVELTALRRRRGGTAILIAEVAPGSATEAAGVRPGQQLLALSDSLRQGEIWEFNSLASLKYTKQMIDGRAGPTIQVRLTPDPVEEWQAAEARARTALGADVAAPALAAAVRAELEQLSSAANAAKQARRDEKLEQRSAYEQDNLGRDNNSNGFFFAALALFIGLPLALVAGAVATGYITPVGRLQAVRVTAKGGSSGKGGGGGKSSGGVEGGGGGNGGGGHHTQMTQEAASRIHSAEARANDGRVAKGSFASRAQSAAARNEGANFESGSWDDE
ncbi:seed maturation family [Micractinium conductrix]|uniref:Seed maturation family n=1 Tax=Micractinium conductrix TaxID=554055 RepID=A0A2P6VFP3_9CHLO|nr:seed maturation family [Micractinium conductrix]|eukprot:PSC72910.1 seed maturation family [Micractinium conductrix]